MEIPTMPPNDVFERMKLTIIMEFKIPFGFYDDDSGEDEKTEEYIVFKSSKLRTIVREDKGILGELLRGLRDRFAM